MIDNLFKNRAQKARYAGRKLEGEDLTVQDGVPTLQRVLDNVLSGRPTGLGQPVYDETDVDVTNMDRLDLEADRQSLLLRSTAKSDDEKGVSSDEVPPAVAPDEVSAVEKPADVPKTEQ